MSLFNEASLVVTPNGYKADKLYSIKPTSGAGDLDFVRNTAATRVNESGLIESVAANVPRLDYTGGGCPSLLLEPQRTNTQKNSENFAAWMGINNITIGSNTTDTIDPAGYYGSDKITLGSGAPIRVFESSGSIAGTNTISLFVKPETSTSISLFTTSASLSVSYNLATQVVTPTTGTGTITSYGNEWYRITATATLGTNETLQILFSGSAGQTIYIWGAQVEAGAYPTSYIPTLSTSVTRVADAASKTGISSLIGQTEGTLFVEEYYDDTVANNGGLDDTLLSTSDGTSSNLIGIFHYGDGALSAARKAIFFIRLSGATQAIITSDALPTGTYKMALAYKNNDVVAYINGVQIGTDTSATIPATSVVTLVDPITTNAATKTVSIKQAILFKTRLTNAELATLTTL